jgi:RNA polymerase sigma factor (TIGR02999 family)
MGGGVCQFFLKRKTMSDASGQVTALLQAAQAGDQGAAERLLALVYDDLHAMATARMARLPPGQTLQPTALVNETFVRLFGKDHHLPLKSRWHFFFAAARAMRNILVEQARRKAGPRRGGGRHRVELTEDMAVDLPPSQDILALNEALEELERVDPLKGQIVHLRYFGGLQMKEIADVLGLPERSLHRQWGHIKAWLKNRLVAPDTIPAPASAWTASSSKEREQALSQLAPEYQQVIRLHFHEGHDFSQVARIMNIPEMNARKLYHQALKKWRETVESRHDD